MKSNLFSKALLIIPALLVLGSCVNEDADPCSSTLRVVYDYNIDQVDKFHAQANHYSLFVFDSQTGLFVKEIKATGGFNEKHEIEIPRSLADNEYDYILWSGLDSDSYTHTPLQEGVTSRWGFSVKVKEYDDQKVTGKLEPQWNGLIENARLSSKSEAQAISLTKNTNTFRLVFSFVSNEEVVHPYDPSALEVGIYTSCNELGCNNRILDEEGYSVFYTPYIAQKEANAGLVYEISTLRLMADREATLVVKEKATGRELFRMPLISYLDLLRLLEESWIETLQEYLDREDYFKIMVFINNDSENWESFRILINDWVVRDHTL